MSNRKTTWASIWVQPVKVYLAAALMAFSPFVSADERSHSANNTELYLRSLPGFWEGEAIETPVGPMNYDMFFHSCDNETIAGVAKTGASLHYWQFRFLHDNSHLRFLSTFRGNREPTMLLLRTIENTTLKYYAPELDLLTLEIAFSNSIVDIRVFHNDNPHVYIRLTRAKSRPAEPSSHHSLANSCRGYPIRDQER